MMPLAITDPLASVAKNDRELLRAHVASYYLGPREYARFLKESYPEVYDSLKQ